MKVVKQKPSKEVNKAVSVEDAVKVLQENEQKRREACWEEIQGVAKKHKFNLGISYTFVLAPIAE